MSQLAAVEIVSWVALGIVIGGVLAWLALGKSREEEPPAFPRTRRRRR